MRRPGRNGSGSLHVGSLCSGHHAGNVFARAVERVVERPGPRSRRGRRSCAESRRRQGGEPRRAAPRRPSGTPAFASPPTPTAGGAGAAITAVLDGCATPAADTTTLAALAGDARAALLAAPVPTPSRTPSSTATGGSGPTCRWRCGRRRPPRICRRELRRPAGHLPQHRRPRGGAAGGPTLLGVAVDRPSRRLSRLQRHRSSPVPLAVVVQRMVDAAVAGVLFTANPVTGRRGHAVIDASPGLGEAVVSGAVNPDHFVVDTATGEIVERRIGDKKIVIRARPAGEPSTSSGRARRRRVPHRRPGPRARGARRAGRGALRRAAGHRVGDRRGRPAVARAGPPHHDPVPAAGERAAAGRRSPRVFCFSVAQGLYRPITPMGLAGFRMLASAASEVLGFPVADPLAGPTRTSRPASGCSPTSRACCGAAPAAARAARLRLHGGALGGRPARLIDDPRLSLTRSWLSFARRVLRIAVAYGSPSPRCAHWPGRGRPRLRPAVGVDLADAWPCPKARPPPSGSRVEQILLSGFISLVPRIMPGPGAGLACSASPASCSATTPGRRPADGAARAAAQRHDRDGPRAVGSRRPHPRRSERRRRLARAPPDELAERFHAGTLPAVVQSGLSAFLRRYGHRAVAEIDLGLPRWSRIPRTSSACSPTTCGSRTEPGAGRAVRPRRGGGGRDDRRPGRAARRRGRLRGRIVRFALGRARALVGARELPKFYLILAVAAVRRQLALVGAELAARGRLAAADDVFFIDLMEAPRGSPGATCGRSSRRGAPPTSASCGAGTCRAWCCPTAPSPRPRARREGRCAGGHPGLGRRVTAAARVILDPVGARLEPARSSWPRRPIPAGRRSSSPPAGW